MTRRIPVKQWRKRRWGGGHHSNAAQAVLTVGKNVTATVTNWLGFGGEDTKPSGTTESQEQLLLLKPQIETVTFKEDKEDEKKGEIYKELYEELKGVLADADKIIEEDAGDYLGVEKRQAEEPFTVEGKDEGTSINVPAGYYIALMGRGIGNLVAPNGAALALIPIKVNNEEDEQAIDTIINNTLNLIKSPQGEIIGNYKGNLEWLSYFIDSSRQKIIFNWKDWPEKDAGKVDESINKILEKTKLVHPPSGGKTDGTKIDW